MIRFVHIADLHLDSPFTGCSLEERRERRNELKNALAAVTSYCNEHSIELLLISGDLFDGDFAGKQTAAFTAECFSRIPNTHVFIAPGNHDHYGHSSPYKYCTFPPNVHIFTEEKLQSVEIPSLGCAVYGYGFNSAKMSERPLSGIHPFDTDRINILVAHGDLDVPSVYYTIKGEDLERSGLDYAALGHIHKPSGLMYFGKTACAYSGCLVGRDFGECGKRGMIVGEITKAGTEIKYVPVTHRSYEEITVDVTGKELSEIMTEIKEKCRNFTEMTSVRIILVGERNEFGSVPKKCVEDALSHVDSIRLSDQSTEMLRYDELLTEYSLRGAFARSLRPYMESDNERIREKGKRALRYGLEALRK